MNDFGKNYNKSIIRSIENSKWAVEDLLQKANDYLLNNCCEFTTSDKNAFLTALSASETQKSNWKTQ